MFLLAVISENKNITNQNTINNTNNRILSEAAGNFTLVYYLGYTTA